MPSLTLSPTRRMLFTLGLILLSGWIISGLYLYLSLGKAAKTEAVNTAQHAARQAALTIQPFLLAEDNISLNFYLNSLTETPQINGILVQDSKQKILTQSGNSFGIEHTVILGEKASPNGYLKLFISDAPQRQLLLHQLTQAAMLSVLVLMIALFSLWSLLRSVIVTAPAPEQAPAPTDIESTTETASFEASAEPFQESTELETSTSEVLASPPPALSESPQADTIPTLLPDTAEASSTESAELSEPTATQPATEDLSDIEDDSLDNDSLVELLKPDNQQRMPHFAPAPLVQDSEHAAPTSVQDTETEEAFELDEDAQPTPLATPERPNPLRTASREEVQLDLYTLEHQLELSLQPKDAAYLLFIDATTGHADYVEPEEHEYLLDTYELLLTQVQAIYGGQQSANASGDLQLLFDDQDEEDNHGIHALCAAKLFSLLYRTFNQSRIRNMRPVLNLHLALVRGNRNKFNLLKEEALFLTRTTQTNDLISHTALTEAAHLKNTLLQGANIRREDEDKVLIVGLNESYQQLLRQQAEHVLLKKTDSV